jgi:putative ABC transport system ATP-binding protein
MVALRSVSFSYNKSNPIIFKDWDIKAAEHWLLLGDSGSGKSTLLHILTGILMPDKGEVLINDTDLYALPNMERDQFRGRHIGVVLQQAHLMNNFSVKENLMLAQSFAGLKVDFKRIDEVLASLGLLDKKHNFPNQLSQGQLQRVSIARAVINKPSLLVADEPTSSLDDQNTTAVLELLISQSELNQATLIVATHDKRVKDRFKNEYLM